MNHDANTVHTTLGGGGSVSALLEVDAAELLAVSGGRHVALTVP
jgi:hypothetical protein